MIRKTTDRMVNHATGDRISFLQTAEASKGTMSEFIMTLAPGSSWAKSPRHFHPYQTETFEVLSGTLHLTAGDRQYALIPGDAKVVVEPFTLHSFWNDSDEEVSFRAEIYPPRSIEKGIRMTYALSANGKINKNNIPYNPFYTLVLMKDFDAYFSFVPWQLQRSLFQLGAKVAAVFGYK